MKLSAVIINYNTWPTTAQAVSAFLSGAKDLDCEVILIDNGSTETITEEAVKALGIMTFVKNATNLGFAIAANQGVKLASGEYVFFLNSDAFADDDTVSQLAGYLDSHPEISAVGPRCFVYPDGHFQISAGSFPTFWSELIRLSTLYKIWPRDKAYITDTKIEQEADWLSGGAMLLRRQALADCGGFDEHYFFGYEDLDLCFRIKKNGGRIVYYPSARVVHNHGLSSGGKRSVFRATLERDSLVYFLKKNMPLPAWQYRVIKGIYNTKIFIFKLLGL